MTGKTSDMLTVILAGGKGTRLRPYTEDLPKPLVPVGDRPVIEYLLRRLHWCGVREVVMAVNHLAERMEETIGDGRRFGLEVSYSHEEKPLSTVAPLIQIQHLPESFLVVNGDVISDIDFSRVYQYHRQSGVELTVATQKRVHNVDYGVMETDGTGRVTGFSEKPTTEYEVSMGVYVFNRSILDIVPQGRPFGFDDLMRRMLAEGRAVHTYPYDGYWLDIGRIEDYHRALEDLPTITKLLES